MILEFSVKNFLSFKEKVTFSMIANSNKELNDNYVEIGGNKVLKVLQFTAQMLQVNLIYLKY